MAGVAAAKQAPTIAAPIARVFKDLSPTPATHQSDSVRLLTEEVNAKAVKLTEKLCLASNLVG